MRTVPEAIETAWATRNFVGDSRPMARVTVQQGAMRLYDFGSQRYASYVLDNGNLPVEMPNVAKVTWDRNIDADVAEATIEFYNANPLPLGEVPEADWQQLGYFTFNRGASLIARDRWGHEANAWRNMLMPDNIIRTYEGYGFDAEQAPEKDPHLIQTGVWIIDDVILTSGGIIQAKCSDMGRLLLDHHAYRPVVPPDFYPLSFSAVARTSGFYPSSETVYIADWDGPTDPAENETIDSVGSKQASFSWDAPPEIEPEEELPAEFVGGEAFRDQENDRYYVRMPGDKWWGASGPGQIAGVDYLYGPYVDVSAASIGAVQGSVLDLFGGPGQIEKYTPRYELVGYRVYLDGVLQGLSLEETVESVTIPRLTNGVMYGFQVAPVYQELDTGRREAGTRTPTIFFSPRTDGTYPIVTEDSVQADFDAGGSPADGYVSWAFTGNTTGDPIKWTVVLFRGEEREVFQFTDGAPAVSGTRDVDTGEAELDEWNILVYGRTDNGIGSGWQVFRTSGGDAEFFGSGGVPGVPPEPPPATGRAAATGETGFTEPLNPTSVRPTYETSSNYPYVGAGGAVYGHYGADAFDGDINSYWLSVGNGRPDYGFAYEWVQGTVPNIALVSVGVRTAYTNMRCFVSLMVNGAWIQHDPTETIPYDEDDPLARNGGNIPYVASAIVPGGSPGTETRIPLRQAYTGVQRIRVTFANLNDSGLGENQYRAAVNEVMAYADGNQEWIGVPTPQANDTDDGGDTEYHGAHVRGGAGVRPGTYEDYSDIVKLLCAWAGLFWPEDGRIYASDGTYEEHAFGPAPFNLESYIDPVLGGSDTGGGRVWGNIEYAGVAGVADLPVSMFDKRPLMDAIIEIRNILGAIFWVNELGQVIFRRMNVFEIGNNEVTPLEVVTSGRTRVSLDSELHLLDELTVTVSSRNQRERVIVASTDGSVAAAAEPVNPNPTGLRRVAGWTDQGFATNAEARLMADMIALRQLFTYRTDSATIPGYPRIQIDDQILLTEEVTGEGYLHYVTGISSTNDLETGAWKYELDTHWLGSDPEGEWAFDPDLSFAPTTRTYLAMQDSRLARYRS